jgi:phosphatidate cytidylyltransferase
MRRETLKRLLSSLLLIPIALFFIIIGSYFFIFFLGIIFLVTSYEWLKMSRNKAYFLLGIFFLILSFLSAFIIRNDSVHYFILIILICISTDIGGYTFGKLFKGPKLIKISPNKTYSGMIGSFILSIIFVLLFANYFNHNDTFWNLDSYWAKNKLLIYTIFISSISQIGDLTISYFKRKSKIKNTGKIIPGHGGLLDRIDGMIFAIPFAFILFNFLR